MRRHLALACLALALLAFNALRLKPAHADVRLFNSGADAGIVSTINCIGAGITCSRAGSVGRIFIDAGANGIGSQWRNVDSGISYDGGMVQINASLGGAGALLDVWGRQSLATSFAHLRLTGDGGAEGDMRLGNGTILTGDWTPTIWGRSHTSSPVTQDRFGLLLVGEPGADFSGNSAVVFDGRFGGSALTAANILEVRNNNGPALMLVEKGGNFWAGGATLTTPTVDTGTGNGKVAINGSITNAIFNVHALDVNASSTSSSTMGLFCGGATCFNSITFYPRTGPASSAFSFGYGNSSTVSPFTSAAFLSTATSTPFVINTAGTLAFRATAFGRVEIPVSARLSKRTLSQCVTDAGTVDNAVEGTIELDYHGGADGGHRTRLCMCTSDGAANPPVTAWQNVVTGTLGDPTTCND